MRRSASIFLAAIFLPSLGLAWLAVHSVRDQQVVLEHQQAIICQNITDVLAKNLQGQMDQVRGDFVQTTRQLLGGSSSPQILAKDFNRKLRDAWPMAEIGFAVDLNGEIYSPKAYDGPDAKTFRDENDRFLSNRENVVVYSSNSMTPNQNGSVWQNGSTNQNSSAAQNNSAKLVFAPLDQLANASADKEENKTRQAQNTPVALKSQASPPGTAKDEDLSASVGGAVTDATLEGGAGQEKSRSTATGGQAGHAMEAPEMDQNAAASSVVTATPASPTVEAASTPAAAMPQDSISDSAKVAFGMPAPAAAAPPMPESAMSSAGKMIPATPPSAPAFNLAAPAVAGKEPAPATVSPESETAAVMPPPPQNAAPSSSGELDGMVQSFAKIQRQVLPQQNVSQLTAPLSNTVPEESDFRRLIGAETSGALARFLENKLRLMVWSHASADTPIVFGAQLDQGRLIEALKASFQIPELAQEGPSLSGGSDYCAAILDDTGHPVALSRPGFTGDWKHPFVATEIGEALPHWEAALYLVDPQQISRAARTLQFTLGLIVLLLVAAIVSGGSLIAADVRRQVRLAQQKTDFVSNVSHELKTPLTSIRVFADLLAEKRVPDEEKQSTYLRIIAAEAARLTRLINNVLDFARMERGAPPGEHHACDLVDSVRDVVETCGPHLENAGVSFQSEIEAETLPITGDRDALAQIILNLVSNAEKYGGNDVLVRVRRQETSAGALGCVDVLDRGPGIPPKQVKTVFEPFHRLDDSLSSGIPGSGLGLTLARRMARAHGGDVTYSPRAGGGSCFTLSVPLGAP